MDYKLGFWVLLALVVGVIIANTSIYIGPDRQKCSKATLGILLKK